VAPCARCPRGCRSSSSPPPSRRSPTWRSIPTSSAIAPRRPLAGTEAVEHYLDLRAGAGLDLAAGARRAPEGDPARRARHRAGRAPPLRDRRGERAVDPRLRAPAPERRGSRGPRPGAGLGRPAGPLRGRRPASRSTPRSTTTGGRCRSADRPSRAPTCAVDALLERVPFDPRGGAGRRRDARAARRRAAAGARGDPGQSRAARPRSTGWRRCWSLRRARRSPSWSPSPATATPPRRVSWRASGSPLGRSKTRSSSALGAPRNRRSGVRATVPGAWGGVRGGFPQGSDPGSPGGQMAKE